MFLKFYRLYMFFHHENKKVNFSIFFFSSTKCKFCFFSLKNVFFHFFFFFNWFFSSLLGYLTNFCFSSNEIFSYFVLNSKFKNFYQNKNLNVRYRKKNLSYRFNQNAFQQKFNMQIWWISEFQGFSLQNVLKYLFFFFF